MSPKFLHRRYCHMEPIIDIQNITKAFKRGEYIEYGSLRDTLTGLFSQRGKRSINTFNALDEVSFSIYPGEALGIVGKNGSGKSTLLKILSRITPPTKGKAILRGRSASLLEVGTGFHSELTGRENVFFNGSLMGLTKGDIQKNFDSIIDFSGVEKFIDTPLKRYSSGMYVRLAFAVAAHLDPEILMVDEVLAVGDFEFQKKCIKKMDDVRKDGRTVIFVSHQMEMIEKLCTRGIILSEGKLKMNGTIEEVVNGYIEMNESSIKNPDFSSIRTPTSDLYMTKATLLNNEGEPSNILKSAESCTIRVHYECHSENIQYFSFWADILNQKYTPMLQFFSGKMKEHVIPVDKTRGYFDINVDKLPLIPGSYNIEFYIHHRGVHMDRISRGLIFEVVYSDYYGSGLLPRVGTICDFSIT